jgi:hypothetical protein
MANYQNKLAVLDDGKVKKVTSADSVEISGGFTAANVNGDGAGLTNLQAGNIAASGTLPVLDGSALTNLDAGNLASGTVPSAQVSGSYTGITGVGTLTAGAIGSGFTAISDTHLATITSAGKVENSATSATSANTTGAIVARDGSGNFSANTITANLAGNASTADYATSAGTASTASSATNADYATSAGNATTADSATTASSAALADAVGSGGSAGTMTISLSGDLSGSVNITTLDGTQTLSATVDSVSHIAIGATSANTADAVVARDSNGDFSAGTISADLSGNASTASQWENARDVSFAGGDVTGSFSIDGSANVSNVDLTIGAGVVDNAMLAGSISDDKLSTISSAGKVADSALSANVPLLDAASNAFTGSMSIQGSLNVTGPIISNGELNVIVHDAFLDLSAGNIGTVAKASGFTSNVKKATGFTAETATAFTAGVLSTSAPTMAIASSTLAAGDIVEVHSSTNGTNDGLYVVASATGSLVTIKGIGGTLPSANVPFVHNQFTTSTGESATVIKVDLAAFAVSSGSLTGSAGAIAVGTFCYNYQAAATESSFASSWTSLSAVTTPDLATVYAAGANADIVLSTGRNFSIAQPTSGTAAISLESNAASKFEAVGAQLDIKTSGSAADVVLSASKSVKVSDAPLLLSMGDGSSVATAGAGFVQSVAAGVSEGDLLYIDTDGVAKKVANTTGRKAQVVALEANGGGAAADKRVGSVVGSKLYITVSGTAPSVGDTLFLSATAGQATKTAPTTGMLQSFGEVIGSAIGSHYPVLWEPRVIADDLGV